GDEHAPAVRPRAVILGAGPNRIGQGIEFDYCCVHAAYALHDADFETVMINCNPETVSTDYDTSDRLYFEPLTYEDVSDILEVEDPAGVLVTFGGQTPLKLARPLEDDGWPMLGTRAEAIDLAEDRQRFSAVLDELEVAYPPAGSATSVEEAREIAHRLGFPLMVRPSYVLGGRGMVIAYDEAYLESHLAEAARVTPDHPVLLDHFLEQAIEVDCDVVCDGTDTYIGGIMEHIEEAGIHSGDSACCIPHFTLPEVTLAEMREIAHRMALRLGVVGLMNVQFAIKESTIYVLEVNPRASRTIPFVSKATGVQLAKVAARVMAGEKLADLGLPPDDRRLARYCVKEAVMPFNRFPGADSVLGPEMKSTGEVMGTAPDFPRAYAKAQLAINYELPTSGTVFLSVCDRDKRAVVGLALSLRGLGFDIVATQGTAQVLGAAGIPSEVVMKKYEGRPNVIDRITNGEIALIINTPFGQETRSDGYHIRAAAIRYRITNVTTLAAAIPIVQAIAARKEGNFDVCALQDFDLPVIARSGEAATRQSTNLASDSEHREALRD
ncbi:MAG: carbamoyl-phosphate synthase large subunit, partial [Coriobacteriia bacterium]|nr:carbamoyl-phosphate synthase large subunit [Coriobacteriia bacterium]